MFNDLNDMPASNELVVSETKHKKVMRDLQRAVTQHSKKPLQQLAEEIREWSTKGDKHAYHQLKAYAQAGNRLKAAKELVGHGNWGSFIKQVGYNNLRTAINHQQIAEIFPLLPEIPPGGGTWTQALALEMHKQLKVDPLLLDLTQDQAADMIEQAAEAAIKKRAPRPLGEQIDSDGDKLLGKMAKGIADDPVAVIDMATKMIPALQDLIERASAQIDSEAD